jgi:hypothetical protein
MKFYNNSKHYVRIAVYSGFPRAETNRVKSLGDYGPGGEASCDLDPGDYYACFYTTNIGPIEPGLIIATSGGVPSEGAVTLTATDRISIS